MVSIYSERTMKNYYEILGLPRNCNQADIKRAYRNLAKEHHPDKNKNENCSEFRDIQEAYETLSESRKRKYYDDQLQYDEFRGISEDRINSHFFDDHIFVDFPFSHLFQQQAFHDFDSQFNRKTESRYSMDLILTPKEAKFGGSVPIDLPIQVSCRECEGSGNSGFWACNACNGSGVQNLEYRVNLNYPSSVNHNEHYETFIKGFGYLNITIKVFEH